MPTVLLLARTWRDAMRRAAGERIPVADRLYVAAPETIRGLATRGVDRRVYPGFDRHPQARQILDCLYVCDMASPAVEAS